MFTGLIEALGEVAAVTPIAAGVRVRLQTSLAAEVAAGDSVAVNGVCLTVTTVGGGAIGADVSPATLRATALGSLAPGSLVNLERPLRADSRLGGHFVQGHVDATGTLDEIRADGEFYWVSVGFPGSLAPYIVPKGSIAVDGISLTVASLDATRFDVQIVPFTWERTNLNAAQAHAAVNLECDILGKYVARVVELGGYGLRPRVDP